MICRSTFSVSPVSGFTLIRPYTSNTGTLAYSGSVSRARNRSTRALTCGNSNTSTMPGW